MLVRIGIDLNGRLRGHITVQINEKKKQKQKQQQHPEPLIVVSAWINLVILKNSILYELRKGNNAGFL